MDRRTIADILAAHADRLTWGRPQVEASPEVGDDQLSTLGPLMRVAERVQSALAPVQPSPAFVRQLGQQLIATTAYSRKAVTVRTRKAILIVAAALGSVVSIASAVGVVIWLIRRRGRRTLSVGRGV
jgi:hypothetical protein